MNEQPNEGTLKQERIHPGIFAFPVLTLFLMSLLTLPVLYFLKETASLLHQFAPQKSVSNLTLFWILPSLIDILPALASLAAVWPAYLSSEVTLTTRRLVYRTGIIERTSGEIPLENVEGLFLSESFLGRLLGYGTLRVTTVGGFEFPIYYLRRPHLFRKTLQDAVNTAKSPHRSGPKMPIPVLDDSRYMPKC